MSTFPFLLYYIITKFFRKVKRIRAIKTFFETMGAMLATYAVLDEINWIAILSSSAISAVICVCTCVASLPEAQLEVSLRKGE